MANDDKDYPNGPGPGPLEEPEEVRVARGLTLSGVDVYASWALGPGRDDFFPSKQQQTRVPMLFELKGIGPENFALGKNEAGVPLLSGHQFSEDEAIAVWQKTVRVSALHLRPEAEQKEVGPNDKRYYTALVYVGPDEPGEMGRKNFFGLLGVAEEQYKNLDEVFLRCTISTPLDVEALPPSDGEGVIDFGPLAGLPDGMSTDDMVVIGVIDDGIAFAHERFRHAPDMTRIQGVWLQAATPAGPLPSGVIPKPDIDRELGEAMSGGIVDEDRVYRKLGAIDFGTVRDIERKGHKSAAMRASHGAHVMDVAAGYPMDEPQTKRPMVCVQLPTEITADTSGYNLDVYVVQAVEYILACADAMVDHGAPKLPVVINFSYGNARDAHDGTSVIERALEQQIKDRDAPLRIVLPSGNSHLSRTHAQVSFNPTISAEDEKKLLWRVQPNDLTWSFMEIWLPRGEAGERVEVTLRAPGSLGQVTLGEVDGQTEYFPSMTEHLSEADKKRVMFSVRYKHVPESNRGQFLIMIRQTEHIDATDVATAPSGLWTVELTNHEFSESDLIHAWIQRDDTPFGYPIYGRQSYFDDPNYQRYNDGGRIVEQDSGQSYVKRGGTISGLATGDETIIIGGVYRREMRAAEYSSGGPTYDADRVGPDASAVSDDTPIHRGILAAGTRSGSRVAIGGTSVAAPQIARWVADQLAGGSNTSGDRTAVQNKAIIEESGAVPPRPPRPPHERGGAGRIIRPPIPEHDRFEH